MNEAVNELVERLRASGTGNAPKNSDAVYMSICDEAADAITTLTASLSQAERDRDSLKWANERISNSLHAHVDALATAESELTRLRALVEEAEKALEPLLSKLAIDEAECANDCDDPECPYNHVASVRGSIEPADYRAARLALTKLRGSKE